MRTTKKRKKKEKKKKKRNLKPTNGIRRTRK